MRTLIFLLKKEFRQIFRNKALLPVIFVMPIIQLLILPLAADYEIKNISIGIVDHDRSTVSRDLINRIVGSGYFRLVDYNASFDQAFKKIESDKADLILEIPTRFSASIGAGDPQKLFLAVNAINGTKANLGAAYLSSIIQQLGSDLILEKQLSSGSAFSSINVVSSNWFNPTMNYAFFMVPGILALLVTMVGAYLCALNIVKEKEIGTIEQINVTPIRKHHFILGKLLPFWIIGIVVFTIGLFVVGYGVYGIVPQGNILVLYACVALYLIALLGLGLLISTYSETQQQAMSVTFFFMMIFLLMSGLFTPIESMPEWSQWIAKSNPVTYFIEVIRMNVLKGSGFSDIKLHVGVMVFFAIFFNSWAILNYRKTS